MPDSLDSTVLLIVVLGLASYRLTRLVVLDTLLGTLPATDPENPRGTGWRRAVDTFAYDETGRDRSFVRGKIGDLLSCTYCAGWWVTLAVVCAWTQTSPLDLGVQGWLVAFAVAGVQSMLNAVEPG